VAKDYVALTINNGTPAFGLLSREGLASANDVSPEGSGFSGVLLPYVVSANDRVDEILAQVEAAGGTVVEPAQEKWGSYPARSPTRTTTSGSRQARVGPSLPSSDPTFSRSRFRRHPGSQVALSCSRRQLPFV
jgi:hypothetical protein